MLETKFENNDHEQCDHRIDSSTSTMRVVKNIRFMVSPQPIYCICMCCGESFKYKKDSNGKYKKVDKNDDDGHDT